MTALARAISSPRSPQYDKFLSPAQVQARFGATGAQQAAVRQWPGPPWAPKVGSVRVNSGSTAQTELVARGSVTAPAGVAGIVTAVNLSAKNPAVLPPPEVGLVKPSTKIKGPCSSYFGQKADSKVPPAYGGQPSYGSCWYTPAQTRSAYGVPAGLSGQGVTVATVGSEPLAGGLRSLQRWSAGNGIAALRPGQLTEAADPATTRSPASAHPPPACSACSGRPPDLTLTVQRAASPGRCGPRGQVPT